MIDSSQKILQVAHSPLKANVYLDLGSTSPVVIKDYSKSPSFIRNTICKLLMEREIRTLQKLDGITGIPKYLGTHGSHAYRMEYIEGISPDHQYLGTTPGLLSQLANIVNQMHIRGITHNDLRPQNLIITSTNHVYLIDFGAVAYRPASIAFWAKPGHWLFNFLCNTDRSKVARLKAEFQPEELTETDQKLISKTRFARKTTRWWKKTVLPVISPTKHRKDKNQN
jgi:serine/threonine protein kinase